MKILKRILRNLLLVSPIPIFFFILYAVFYAFPILGGPVYFPAICLIVVLFGLLLGMKV